MPKYEYKVVPAPVKGVKAKGLKGTQERFAHALSNLMNDLGADGWEYQRADTLPCEERQGLTGKTKTFQNMLIFRRVIAAASVTDGPAQPDAELRGDDATAAQTKLVVHADEGVAPSIATTADAGNAPSLGPAGRPEDAAKRSDGVAAE